MEYKPPRNHFRSSLRKKCAIPIKIKVRSRDAIETRSCDIGTEGVFLLSDQPLPKGACVALSLSLEPEEPTFEVFGLVRWNNGLGEGGGDGPSTPEVSGMGIQFLGLNVDQLLRLSTWLDQ